MATFIIRFYDDEAIFLACAADEDGAKDAFLADRERAGALAAMKDQAGEDDVRSLCEVLLVPTLAPGEVAYIGGSLL